MDYYTLFDIKPSPEIDEAGISKKYIQLQKLFHPDFRQGEGPEELEKAEEMAAAINKAYKIFRDKEARVAYFLQYHGYLTEDEKFELPPDFLMEMMEINELLDADENACRKEAESMGAELDKERHNIINYIHSEPQQTGLYENLKSNYFKKKYLLRLLDRLKD